MKCCRNHAGHIPIFRVREIGRFVFAGGPMRLQGKYGFPYGIVCRLQPVMLQGAPGRKESFQLRDRPLNFHGKSRVGYQFNREVEIRIPVIYMFSFRIPKGPRMSLYNRPICLSTTASTCKARKPRWRARLRERSPAWPLQKPFRIKPMQRLGGGHQAHGMVMQARPSLRLNPVADLWRGYGIQELAPADICGYDMIKIT